MRRSRTGAASASPLLLLGSLAGGVAAGVSPHFSDIAVLDPSVDRRQDFCARQRLVINGTIGIEDALRNASLNVALSAHAPFHPSRYRYSFLTENGTIPGHYPGYLVTILDELADRAGFTWRESFEAFDLQEIEQMLKGDDKDYTDILKWQVGSFDLAVDTWANSVERMATGVAFPYHFYDFSTILVEREPETKEGFEFGSVFKPFTLGVWALIVISMVFTGLAFWWLKHMDARIHGTEPGESAEDAVYSSSMIFVGGGDFEATTRPTRLVAFSWFFAILVIVASYTANMASFMVAPEDEEFLIASMEQAGKDGRRICIHEEGYTFERVKSVYGGSGIELVGYPSDFDALKALAGGECDAYIGDEGNLQQFPGCSLQFNGVYLFDVSAKRGFASAVDAGQRCTSLLYHALDVHLMRMRRDGATDKAWEKYLNHTHGDACDVDASDGGDDDGASAQLNVTDMGGVFGIHLIFSAVAVLIVAVQYFARGAFSSEPERVDEAVKGVEMAVETNCSAAQAEEGSPSTTNIENATETLRTMSTAATLEDASMSTSGREFQKFLNVCNG